MENTITLFVGPDLLWQAKFAGPHARQVIDLFGTDTLPTPFGQRYPAAKVLAHIKERNPQCTVTFGADLQREGGSDGHNL